MSSPPPSVGPSALGGVLAVVLAAAAGCASAPAVSVHRADTPETSLTVRVTARPGASPRVWRLRCDPPGGTHPNPAGACAALARAKNPFAPVPTGTVCAQIYGGPQTAAITGVWRGRTVSAHYTRRNGCETARWNALSAVLDAT